ncbi:MAG: DUF3048 domain-containing protein [Fusicatenibacter sp.]|nr:DUF3048 domain-containing protein [Fusicatenibacter sp.]
MKGGWLIRSFYRIRPIFLMALLLLSFCSCKKEETLSDAKGTVSDAAETISKSEQPEENKSETPVTEWKEEPEQEPLTAVNLEEPYELQEGMMYSYLTGEPVPEEIGHQRPIAVMLNNIYDACPQSGISRAGIIYEAPVEGGITRLMGVFEDYGDLTKIGSVRSCREYFVYLDTGLDAIYFHYGQAAYAIPLLESDRIDNVNGMDYSEEVYYRTSDRKAPHNAYLSADGVERGISLCNYRRNYPEDYQGAFVFASPEEAQTLEEGYPAKKVIPGGYFHNNPWFAYDEATGTYLRYQFGEPQIDEMNGEQLSAKNLILQYCSWEKYPDSDEYLNIDVCSGGTGVYVTNGKAVDITWSREEDFGPTSYLDKEGNPIVLNPGKTWILIILDTYSDSTQITE